MAFSLWSLASMATFTEVTALRSTSGEYCRLTRVRLKNAAISSGERVTGRIRSWRGNTMRAEASPKATLEPKVPS
jgi:hypothetical protein